MKITDNETYKKIFEYKLFALGGSKKEKKFGRQTVYIDAFGKEFDLSNLSKEIMIYRCGAYELVKISDIINIEKTIQDAFEEKRALVSNITKNKFINSGGMIVIDENGNNRYISSDGKEISPSFFDFSSDKKVNDAYNELIDSKNSKEKVEIVVEKDGNINIGDVTTEDYDKEYFDILSDLILDSYEKKYY